MKLIIETKDLGEVSEQELREAGFISETDFWIDLLYLDPSQVLDGAKFMLEKDDAEALK